MPTLSNKVVDFLDAALGGRTAEEVGAKFFRSLQPFGANAIFARAYGLTGDQAGSERVLARISPPGWEALYAEKHFESCNYLAREAPRRWKPFRWSDIKLISAGERILAQTLKDCGFPDGLASPCHGPMGYIGVVSLAFERLDDVSPQETEAIELASVVLHDRMRDLALPTRPIGKVLSPRERDCLGFVANGRTDKQIAEFLQLSETTILSHIESAKRKLGVRSRAHAVAAGLLRGLL